MNRHGMNEYPKGGVLSLALALMNMMAAVHLALPSLVHNSEVANSRALASRK